jgi:hypothetical protein
VTGRFGSRLCENVFERASGLRRQPSVTVAVMQIREVVVPMPQRLVMVQV